MKNKCVLFIVIFVSLFTASNAQYYKNTYKPIGNLNKPEREEWLKDAGFGMFIHFMFDSQLGIVISHSMVGASDDYVDRFINELPKTFNPNKFEPQELAKLAKLAGMKYVVFGTKHHSGFCLWDTKTTNFNIMNTEYGKDLLQDYVKAIREMGLAVGFYFSPEDFNFLYENNQTVRRVGGKPLPKDVLEKYFELTRQQCTELMTNYGKIDVMFFDGGDGGVMEVAKETCWNIQPDLLITRGAISTPEQKLPGVAFNDAWETCITMGTQWQYKPTNEIYKDGTRLIEILIETRAKGGSLLLNIGPKPNGEIPIEQEEILREIAAWRFINQDAIYNTRPWIITNEDNIWFTKDKRNNTVYAFITKIPDWTRGERKEFVLKSLKATDKTKVFVLGQSDEVVEYKADVDATTRYEQKEDGLYISCVRAQRIYNNHEWPNPIVLKITNVEPTLVPPAVQTMGAELLKDKVILKGKLLNMGDADKLKVGFMFRPHTGLMNLYEDTWEGTQLIDISETGEFEIELKNLGNHDRYWYRARVVHPKIEIYGDNERFNLNNRPNDGIF